jgi:hypothetical protein
MSEYQPPPHTGDGETPPSGNAAYPAYPASYGAPQYPTPQEGLGAPGGPVPQPRSIQTAVRLMWAGAALSAISLVITLATLSSLKSHLRQQLLDTNSQYTADDFDNLYHAAVALAVVSSLIAIGLWLWMAWKNGQGRGWARVVATVLGGLNLVSSAYAVASNNTIAVSMILTVLNLVLALAILVLLWNKESSAFYADTARRSSQFGR